MELLLKEKHTQYTHKHTLQMKGKVPFIHKTLMPHGLSVGLGLGLDLVYMNSKRLTNITLNILDYQVQCPTNLNNYILNDTMTKSLI